MLISQLIPLLCKILTEQGDQKVTFNRQEISDEWLLEPTGLHLFGESPSQENKVLLECINLLSKDVEDLKRSRGLNAKRTTDLEDAVIALEEKAKHLDDKIRALAPKK